MKGTFTISLDFELHWGGFEKWPLDAYRNYFLNTRQVIPEMLRLFTEYEVHVTWATVGMLMHSSRNEAEQNFPQARPTYKIHQLSAYQYIETKGIGADEAEDPFHYASSLVKKILQTPYQEIGSHTFSHYYCNEEGQTQQQFLEDLRSAKRAAALHGISLKSLVFPRNQFNDAYLRICFDEGITSVRSNPVDWFWKIDSTVKESMWKRLNRGMDAYVPIGSRNSYAISSIAALPGLPVCIPASRLLRPYNPKEFFLNGMKIERIKNEMVYAAAHGHVYHLWWHPHNFGHFPQESVSGLKSILEGYARCRKEYGMDSMSMNELTNRIRNER